MQTIALDFDGVLHSYSSGWTGPEPTDLPVPGARDFAYWLLERGFNVYVFTARAKHERGIPEIQRWLDRHGFPPLHVTAFKDPAHLYVDDRGYRFDGSFDALRAVLEAGVPVPWTKRAAI